MFLLVVSDGVRISKDAKFMPAAQFSNGLVIKVGEIINSITVSRSASVTDNIHGKFTMTVVNILHT